MVVRLWVAVCLECRMAELIISTIKGKYTQLHPGQVLMKDSRQAGLFHLSSCWSIPTPAGCGSGSAPAGKAKHPTVGLASSHPPLSEKKVKESYCDSNRLNLWFCFLFNINIPVKHRLHEINSIVQIEAKTGWLLVVMFNCNLDQLEQTVSNKKN